MGSPGLNEQSFYIIPDKKRDRQIFFIQSRWSDCSLVSGLILYSRLELITTSSEFLKVVLLGPLLRITNSQGEGLFSRGMFSMGKMRMLAFTPKLLPK